MKVSAQIQARRMQLGISVAELAKRVDVTPQSIRYWEMGRSHPGKHKIADLQAALSFTIDFTEGAGKKDRPTTESLMRQEDVEMLMLLSRLPYHVKQIITQLASAFLAGGQEPFSVKESMRPAAAFKQQTTKKNAQQEKRKHRPTARRAA